MNLSTQFLNKIRAQLPIQNPLSSFVHNNPMQYFEQYPFFEGLIRAGYLYHAKALPDTHLLDEQAQQYQLDLASVSTLSLPAKNIPKTLIDSLKKRGTYRQAAYFEIIHHFPFERHIHDLMIPLIASFLDQGMCDWRHSYQREGFWQFFCAHIKMIPNFEKKHVPYIKDIIHQINNCGNDDKCYYFITQEQIRRNLNETEFEQFILEILFQLKGWSGMINKFELDQGQAPLRLSHVKLQEWIAALLCCEWALEKYCEDIFLSDDPHVREQQKQNINTFKPITPQWLEQAESRIHKLYQIDTLHFKQAIKLLEPHTKKAHQVNFNAASKDSIKGVLLTCMDDREESFRRIFESHFPDWQTEGVLGFFNLEMYYSSYGHPKARWQCPPVIKPRFKIKEVCQDKQGTENARVRLLAWLQKGLFYRTRGLLTGFVTTFLLGPLSFLSLLWRIFFPRTSSLAFDSVLRMFLKTPRTKVQLEDDQGYDVSQMADLVERLLRGAGYDQSTRFLPRFVYLVAHGSTTRNNPFKQAYGCGACSGNAGDVNAKTFALMANDTRVKKYLQTERGYPIDEQTRFVAAYHDTTSDEFLVLNADSFSIEEQAEIQQFKKQLAPVLALNALERSQRFLSFSSFKNAKQAKQHVEARARDLAQPRPEYGHNGIQYAIFAKRKNTTHLNLHRAAFLITYHYDQDKTGNILRDLLQGAAPVGANISFDYYFSCMDPDHFGSGSKLPLNITSLLGVMSGSKSDLRIGLARQMTEQHPLFRLKVFIEAELDQITKAVEQIPRLQKLIENQWIFVAQIDPQTGHIRAL